MVWKVFLVSNTLWPEGYWMGLGRPFSPKLLEWLWVIKTLLYTNLGVDRQEERKWGRRKEREGGTLVALVRCNRRFRKTLWKEGLLLPDIFKLVISSLLNAEIFFMKLIPILESALYSLEIKHFFTVYGLVFLHHFQL